VRARVSLAREKSKPSKREADSINFIRRGVDRARENGGAIDRTASSIYHADRQIATFARVAGIPARGREPSGRWGNPRGRFAMQARARAWSHVSRVMILPSRPRSMGGIGIGIYIAPRADRLGFNWVN